MQYGITGVMITATKGPSSSPYHFHRRDLMKLLHEFCTFHQSVPLSVSKRKTLGKCVKFGTGG